MVNDALTELFPVIEVERVPAELLWLSGWHVGVGSAQLAAEVGSTSKIQLFNPDDSAHLIVLTRVDFSTSVGIIVEATTSLAALTTDVGGAQFRDTRTGISEGTVGQIRTQVDGVGLPGTWQFRTLANVTGTIKDENAVAVLAPGTGYTIAPAGTNQFIVASFFWRERLAEPSELNF